MTDTLASNGYRQQPHIPCCCHCRHGRLLAGTYCSLFVTEDSFGVAVSDTAICDRYEPSERADAASQDVPASGGRCPECGSAVRVRGCRWCGKTWIGLRDSRRLYCSKACGDAAREQKKQKQQH